MSRVLLNAALFQVGWFAAVLGAASGRPWLGPLIIGVILLIHLGWAERRTGELLLLTTAGAAGFIIDSVLTAGGLFTPRHHLLPAPWSPPWMVSLWLNFAATLNVSLRWLHGRLLLAALFGAVGGPLAYYAGARLGAALALPTFTGLAALALVWATATPLLVHLAERTRRSPCVTA